jgi:hypothetical protein
MNGRGRSLATPGSIDMLQAGQLPAKEINYNLVQTLRPPFGRGFRLGHVSFICFVQRPLPVEQLVLTLAGVTRVCLLGEPPAGKWDVNFF